MSMAVFLVNMFIYSGRHNHIEDMGGLVAPSEVMFLEYFLYRQMELASAIQTRSLTRLTTPTVGSRDDVKMDCSFTLRGRTLDKAPECSRNDPQTSCFFTNRGCCKRRLATSSNF